MDILVALAALGILAVICALVGFLAIHKGFNFFPWFFTGVLGLIFLLFLPAASEKGISDLERGIRIDRGRDMGKKLAIVQIALILIRVMASMS